MTKNELINRGRLVRALLEAELEHRGATTKKHTSRQFVESARAVAVKMWGSSTLKVSKDDAEEILRHFSWLQAGIYWINPFGGGYPVDEALTRVLQARVEIV